MEQVILSGHLNDSHQNTSTLAHNGIMTRFINWCDGQEDNRFLWLGIAFMGNVGMVLPLTLLSVLFFAGNNFALWIAACVVNVPVLALNLAAQHTRVTLPTLFLAWLVNALIILTSVVIYFTA